MFEKRRTAAAIWLGAALFLGLTLEARAGELLTREQILERLAHHQPLSPIMLDVAFPASHGEDRLEANRKLVEEVRRKTAAGDELTVPERRKLIKLAQRHGYASLDLYIEFDRGSAAIRPQAAQALQALGEALISAELAGKTILIAAHADGKGVRGYNLALSERRAANIKAFLVKRFKLDKQSLIAIGYGNEAPKNPDDPQSPENRRVQIVNLTK